MPRRKSVNIIRDIGTDPVYNQENIQKFINVVMWRGKKNTARRVVYGALDIIKKKFNNDNDFLVDVFNKAIQNATPLVEVKARRVGGSVYQVPSEVRPLRGRALAFREIINASKARNGKTFSIKLAAELLDAYESKGGAVKARLDRHKTAESNKTFSHLTW